VVLGAAGLGVALAAQAQFQVPVAAARDTPGPAQREARELARELDFQYTYGSDTEYNFHRNLDLNNGVNDAAQYLAPTVFFLAAKRPLPWLELNLGATYEQQFRIREDDPVRLPDGTLERAPRRGGTIKVDVANVVLHDLPHLKGLEISFGRRAYEDPRLDLYDTTLDGWYLRYKTATTVTELSKTREDHWNLTAFEDITSSVDNYMLYHEYRGIEDHKIAGYAIKRLDHVPRGEGRPVLYGVRAWGRPVDEWNYWAGYGVVRGDDESATPKSLHGSGFDVGGTYRFLALAGAPCVTAAYAYGSGDENTRDSVNREYRQSGLQSNETKFCGVTQFKRYGEFLDPELSNLRIVTFGIGFRPWANVHIEVVHHHFMLNHIANDVRNGFPTAEMNRFAPLATRNVGQEIDVVVGLRRLFETKFAIDLRWGLFFPGKAYVRNEGSSRSPLLRDADRGVKLLAILSY
jgi:alginate production protein